MTNNLGPEINRGRIQQLNIYEISDNELDVLEKGSPASLCLNIAIFLLSIALSFFVTLVTVKIDNMILQITFIIVVVICTVVGLVLLCFWFKDSKVVSENVMKIKQRLPKKGVIKKLRITKKRLGGLGTDAKTLYDLLPEGKRITNGKAMEKTGWEKERLKIAKDELKEKKFIEVKASFGGPFGKMK